MNLRVALLFATVMALAAALLFESQTVGAVGLLLAAATISAERSARRKTSRARVRKVLARSSEPESRRRYYTFL